MKNSCIKPGSFLIFIFLCLISIHLFEQIPFQSMTHDTLIFSKKEKMLTTKEVDVENLKTSSVQVSNIYQGYAHLDQPFSELRGTVVRITGWAVSDCKDSIIKVYLDDVDVTDKLSRNKRDDVIEFFGGKYSDELNPLPGFDSYIDVYSYQDGEHSVRLELLSLEGELIAKTIKKFNLDKYDGYVHLDQPFDEVHGDVVRITGWAVSDCEDSMIKVYLNDVDVTDKLSRNKRDDVIEFFGGKYSDELNPLPGFDSYINVSGYKSGKNIVRLEILSETGELISSTTKSFNLDKYDGYAHLDQPFDGIHGDVLRVTGWAVSDCEESIIKVYLDDDDVTDKLSRNKRDDVIELFNGKYSSKLNPLPGFDSYIDVSGYKDGVHTVHLEILSKSGNVIASTTQNFNLDKYDGYVHLDQPFEEAVGDVLRVTGWAVSDCKDSIVKVYINDDDITEQISRNKRDDVITLFDGKYSDELNPLPGFDSYIDVSSYKDGENTVKLEILSKNGEVIASTTKKFNLDKYDGYVHLDQPFEEVVGDVLRVTGWAVSDCKDSIVKVYINDDDITEQISRNKRDDVITLFAGKYSDELNPLPGFDSYIDVSSYKDGENTVKLEILSKNGEVIASTTKKFNLDKYDGYVHLDQPFEEAVGDVLRVTGWAVSDCKDSIVKVYINDDDITEQISRNKRDDVITLFAGKYSDELNPLPGFDSYIDVSSYKDGENTVKLEILSKSGEIIASTKKKFNLKKYDGIIGIDFPTKTNYSNSSILTVSGWELSDLDNSIVKVYLDEVELKVSRYERTDIFDTYPNQYGGISMNATPGYESSISLESFSIGTHIIKILLYSRFGELITTIDKNIYIYDNMYFGIDVSSWQGEINWENVSKTGIDFAVLRLGVGDNFESQDDSYFLRNVSECTKYNIPFGVYIYSYATRLNGDSGLNVDSASIDSELAHVYRVLDKLNSFQRSMLKLPVFIDMEDGSTIYLGKETLTNFADYFCSDIEKKGYNCGIYANKNWLTNYLDSSYLEKKYDIWLAHYTYDYNNSSNYLGMYQLWQYTNVGNLSGVNSSGLDMNISFKKYW